MAPRLLKRRSPLTLRGEATFDKLLRSAERAFSAYGYHRTSVAHICRLSRVANGTFYQYFAGKEEIFVALVKSLTEKLHTELDLPVLNAQGTISHIVSLIQAYLKFLRKHRQLYQVFREAEFICLELSRDFYRHLAERFIEVTNRGIQAKELNPCDTEVVAYCLIGLQEFLALRYVIWFDALTEDVLNAAQKLITQGISRARAMHSISRFSREGRSSRKRTHTVLISGKETRERILQAAEVEFGLNGFHNTNVTDIAKRAGVALGTVYVYFQSKEELFVELIHEINHGLRRASAAAVAGLNDRPSIEQVGFRAFFDFISQHRQAYEIVREAEFVDGRSGRWYYLSLGAPYAQGLAKAMKQREIAQMAEVPLAFQLMGIGHFIGLRWLIWPMFSASSDEVSATLPEPVFEQTLRFILYGLSA
jgi:AcrR family transcriptional regulator